MAWSIILQSLVIILITVAIAEGIAWLIEGRSKSELENELGEES